MMFPQSSTEGLEELETPVDVVEPNYEKSEIAQFFKGSNVLVTGGTGFIGKLIVEKLLRSCPDISSIYFTIRPKKGKSTEERFKESFNDVVFNRLRRERPNALSKVIMVECDTGLEDFGLSPENKKLLTKTNVIFHSAASVRLQENFRVAANINVRSVKQLLLFAKEIPNLKAFVYVSTAYSYCIHKTIEEKHYKPPMSGDQLLSLMDIVDDDKLEKMTPVLIENWPNTYSFTKALAENMVLQYSDDLPCCILRPSIVISTDKDPCRAWTNNLYGATGVVVGAGIGLLRTLYCDPDNIADLMPADYVVANIIAAAWDTANSYQNKSLNSIKAAPKVELTDEERVPVYNIVSSPQNPISWGIYMKYNEEAGVLYPPSQIMWYYIFRLNKYKFVHDISVIFLHYLPAIIMDMLAFLIGRKPMMLKLYKKIHKFLDVIHHFSASEWTFVDDNARKLWDKLNPVDRELFKCDIKTLDWADYNRFHIVGLRLYIAKDPLSTVPEALIKYKRMKIAHFTLLAVLSLLFIWGLYTFTTFILRVIF